MAVCVRTPPNGAGQGVNLHAAAQSLLRFLVGLQCPGEITPAGARLLLELDRAYTTNHDIELHRHELDTLCGRLREDWRTKSDSAPLTLLMRMKGSPTGDQFTEEIE